MSKAKAIDERWVVIDGNLATERIFDYESAYGIKLKDRMWLAFNIGRELGGHIAKLHNSHLLAKDGSDDIIF